MRIQLGLIRVSQLTLRLTMVLAIGMCMAARGGAETSDAGDTVTIDFEGMGAKGPVNVAPPLPGNSEGVWSEAIRGFQFMSADGKLSLGISGDKVGLGKVDWTPGTIQMKRIDGGSFCLQQFTMLRGANWLGDDYVWSISGFDAVEGGKAVFSERFVAASVPFVAKLSAANAAVPVKRIEFGGYMDCPKVDVNGPSLLHNIIVSGKDLPTAKVPATIPASSEHK